MDEKTLNELRRECRRWWAVERRGMQVALANMETYRRAGKLTNDIKKDAIQWANERRRRMRLAAAARVGATALANNSRVKQFVSSAGFGELEAAATQQSGVGGWRDSVTCPYCGHEHEDSRDMGCPDMDWTEETECAMCEKTFEWSRLTTTQYLARPVAGEGESGNDSEPRHSPNDPSSATRGGELPK